MLSKEQISELKKQLSEQIKHLPAEKKAQAQKQIDSMSSEALEEMLQEQRSSPHKNSQSQGIFRMIVAGEIPSKIIEQNPEALAVLEIKPVSKAHIMIIPKIPVVGKNKMPPKAFTLARKISKRIGSKLKAESVEIQTETKFGEQIINVIPKYKNSSNTQRYDAPESELEEVQNKLKIVKRTRKSKQSPVKSLPVLKRRIP